MCVAIHVQPACRCMVHQTQSDALLCTAHQVICNLSVLCGPMAIAAALQQADLGAYLPLIVWNEGAAEVKFAQEPLKLFDGAGQLHTQQELQCLASNAVFTGGGLHFEAQDR